MKINSLPFDWQVASQKPDVAEYGSLALIVLDRRQVAALTLAAVAIDHCVCLAKSEVNRSRAFKN